MFAPLAELGVRVEEMDPRDALSGLYPQEELFVARAVDRRRREFTAGRLCARRAIAALGLSPSPIGRNEDGAPAWPLPIVGSVTHSHRWCAAAVALKSDGFESVGLDVEPAEDLPEDLVETVCRREELAWIDRHPSAERLLLARIVFSAKECAYKCQYTLSATMLDFDAFIVELDRKRDRFVATFQRDAPPFVRGDAMQGAVRVVADNIATMMVLPTASSMAKPRFERL